MFNKKLLERIDEKLEAFKIGLVAENNRVRDQMYSHLMEFQTRFENEISGNVFTKEQHVSFHQYCADYFHEHSTKLDEIRKMLIKLEKTINKKVKTVKKK